MAAFPGDKFLKTQKSQTVNRKNSDDIAKSISEILSKTCEIRRDSDVTNGRGTDVTNNASVRRGSDITRKLSNGAAADRAVTKGRVGDDVDRDVNHDVTRGSKGERRQSRKSESSEDGENRGRGRRMSVFSQSGVPDLTDSVDLDYFRGYATIQVQEEMLSDRIRTNTYRYALLDSHKELEGRCVMDVGAGTGILSVFAVQAGSRKVYAVEACGMATRAKEVVKENKMEDKVEVINQLVEDVELSEKVDAIVSEWMGYCLVYEAILPSVLRARDSFLRPGGLMFPCKATLYMAPIHDRQYLERLHFWKDMKSVYGVSMECIIPAAHACFSADVEVKIVEAECVQAAPVTLCSYDLYTVSADQVQHVQSEFQFKCFGRTTITGFVTWWTTDFPGGSILNTSPYHPSTHWQHVAFHLRRSFPVETDTEIRGTFTMNPHYLNHRCMEMMLDFTVGGTESHVQNFSLHSTMPGRSLHDASTPPPSSPI